jgi:hypothetical protein
VDRRAAFLLSRRIIHEKNRRCGIVDQTKDSSMEGPDDSRTAQKAQKALKARKA